ncbi:MAG: polysaccharide deacetylase family protein [Pseudomonadota bacterium]|nr:polysaccharide deacetylase family protein [Pseudomonadota bacterium]
MISFTIDLEDPTEAYEPEGRYAASTRHILDLCDEYRCRATFFTVGRIAERSPTLIRDIASRGHEIGYHSRNHVPLTKEDPERFRDEAKRDKARLEELAGKSVNGFRAPAFSLTQKTLWAVDVLKEIGFAYSSSIMPTWVSRYGFPGAPRTPFRWPNGLIELPLPVGTLGPLTLPYLGGIYMFSTSFWLVKMFARQAGAGEILWTYAHPYDFDKDERFIVRLHGSVLASSILWMARGVAEKKIRKVLDLGVGPPLGSRIQSVGMDCIYTPPAPGPDQISAA